MPQGLQWPKVQDIYDQEIHKMVNAKNQEEGLAVYGQVKDMDAAGLMEVEDYITKAYQERMELWGK